MNIKEFLEDLKEGKEPKVRYNVIVNGEWIASYDDEDKAWDVALGYQNDDSGYYGMYPNAYVETEYLDNEDEVSPEEYGDELLNDFETSHPWNDDFDESLKESQAQEIGQEYKRLSNKYNVDFNDLVYGKDGFMKSMYPDNPDYVYFPDFNGDVIFSQKHWNELVDWAEKNKGIKLDKWDDTKYKDEFDENLQEGWVQFTFEDGSNPYIAKTKEEQDRMFKKYKGRIKQVGDITYLVKKETKLKEGLYEFSKPDKKAIIQWWKDISEIEDNYVDVSNIDKALENDDDFFSWFSAMYDVLNDLRYNFIEKDNDKREYLTNLYRKGKRLYNKYALSQFNEDLSDAWHEKAQYELTFEDGHKETDSVYEYIKDNYSDEELIDMFQEYYDDKIVSIKQIGWFRENLKEDNSLANKLNTLLPNELEEDLDTTQKLINSAKKFAKDSDTDVKVMGIVNSGEVSISTFPEDFNEMVELFNTQFDVYDEDEELEKFKIKYKELV